MDCRNNILKCGLINLQSICNKSLEVSELIKDKGIDILIITESWLKGTPGDKAIIRESTPSTHKFFHEARKNRRGGGVAIIINKMCKNIVTDKSFVSQTYEYIDLSFTIANRKYRILNVYRPQGVFTTFLSEFNRHLDSLTESHSHLIVTGDFNCWVDIDENSQSRRFRELIDLQNFKILNDQPTTRDGHILDLIISNTNPQFLKNFMTYDYFSGVHFFISFEIVIRRRPVETTKIEYHSKRNFDPLKFIEKSSSELEEKANNSCECDIPVEVSIGECVHCYSKYYNEIFSKNYLDMCPLITRVVKDKDRAGWYNENINLAKREKRRRELDWRRDKTEEKRRLFNQSRNQLNRLLRKSKKEFYQRKLVETEGDGKKCKSY